MRVLLRDPGSGKYLTAKRTWTTQARLGRDFGTTAAAVKCSMDLKRGTLEVVLTFDDPSFNFAIRVGSSLVPAVGTADVPRCER